MRDIKTLLQTVIDSLGRGNKEGWFNYGICGEILNLEHIETINTNEGNLLIKIIYENKPSNGRFTESILWIGKSL